MNHICKEGTYCTCSIVGLEPDEECPQHGGGIWPPRCAYCGRFVKRNYYDQDLRASEPESGLLVNPT